jgi:hypothetical protein
VDRPVEGREALLAVAVHVFGELVTGFDAGREERLEQRIGRRTAFEDQRAAMAAPGIVRSGREACLHLPEVREAVGVVPRRHARIRRPALVVQWVAALEDLPVDARRPAEDLAAGVVDPAAVHERLGLRFVLPVVPAAADREREGGRHVDEHVEAVVRPARLQDQDLRPRIGREPVGEHAPGRATAHDDDVVSACRHGTPMLADVHPVTWNGGGSDDPPPSVPPRSGLARDPVLPAAVQSPLWSGARLEPADREPAAAGAGEEDGRSHARAGQ